MCHKAIIHFCGSKQRSNRLSRAVVSIWVHTTNNDPPTLMFWRWNPNAYYFLLKNRLALDSNRLVRFWSAATPQKSEQFCHCNASAMIINSLSGGIHYTSEFCSSHLSSLRVCVGLHTRVPHGDCNLESVRSLPVKIPCRLRRKKKRDERR